MARTHHHLRAHGAHLRGTRAPVPEAGGFAAYTERAFGRKAGALAGWLFFLSIPSGCAIVALIVARYVADATGIGREPAAVVRFPPGEVPYAAPLAPVPVRGVPELDGRRVCVRRGGGAAAAISTSSYIATYVLAMAAGVRLLAGAPRAGAFIALAACVLVLAFVGALLAWIVGVTAACLAYQAWAGRYPLNARSAIG